jgi:hypothetical protein
MSISNLQGRCCVLRISSEKAEKLGSDTTPAVPDPTTGIQVRTRNHGSYSRHMGRDKLITISRRQWLCCWELVFSSERRDGDADISTTCSGVVLGRCRASDTYPWGSTQSKEEPT